MYEIIIKRQVEKDLKKIDRQFIEKIINKIEKLKDEPHPRNSLKLADTDNTYRLRVGDYRIIYQVDDDINCLTVFYIRHRKDAYK